MATVTVKREEWPRATVGYRYTIGVPVLDEDGGPMNLDSATLAAKALDPAGNKISLTATARGGTSNIFDVQISASQMTTGGEGEWKVDVYVETERPQDGRFAFAAEPKETE